MTTFGINDHARKHDKRPNPFTESPLSLEEILQIVEQNWGDRKPGSRKGVFEVPLPCSLFLSPTVRLTAETKTVNEFDVRRGAEEGEEANQKTFALDGEKTPCESAVAIVYSRDALLANNGKPSTDADFELVTYLGSASAEPMLPVTMARNFLKKVGGTPTEYTAQQFAEAIWYWSQHAPLGAHLL